MEKEPKKENLFTEKDVEHVKKENERITIGEHKLSAEDQEIYERMLAEAKMPVKITDDKFELGKNELDIRGLSRANKDQMQFRSETLNAIYLRQLLDTGTDIIRLLMVIAKALGVKDITQAIDHIESELRKTLINDNKDKVN